MKLRQLMHLLKKEDYFGPTVADIYTIEFQNRGLPHAHILLWLRRGSEEVSTDFIDTIIHAEIPDKNKEPRFYEIVSRSMVHGPCGKDGPNCPCMMNDVCTKKYPKGHNESTTLDRNGYPVYVRRKDSRNIKKGIHEMDNRSIVPYNPGLLLMFDAHINVEWCNTAKAIKYLFKYISKGPDKATLVIQEDTQDQIKAYMDCRYLSASEAAWRIFEFGIQERYPSVMRLPVHLEGEQSVVIKDSDMLEEIFEEKNSTNTMMTAWMATNANQPDARTLSYAEFPTKYVRKEGGWHKRKQGKCIGRMVYVHPTAGEKYYLRVLLNIIKGAQSYQEIRTLGDVVYPTFKEACYEHGLLNNDKEWHEAMSEANKWAMPSQLRELFVTMILFCEVTDITKLWEESYGMLSEDIGRKKRRLFGDPNLELSDAAKRPYTLLEIDKILMRYGTRLSDIESMPQPVESDVHGMENRLIRDERKYDRKQLRDEWEGKVKLLNREQKVINAVSSKLHELFFVYGHGGTGKTFLYGAISAKLRSEGKIVLNVASYRGVTTTGGGRTVDSRFDIPIELFDDSTCNVKQNSQLAELLRETSLIIWDEAPMDHRNAFEALDRTMRDIVSYTDPDASSKMFGGKVVLLGGDFRQVLPIVSKGKRQDIVQASISRSHIWRSCTVFLLRKSMRVTDSDGQRQRFNKWLLAMGDGRLEAKAEEHEDEGTWIKIPEEYTSVCGKLDIKQVVDEIYPSFVEGSKDDEYLRERAILTPLNETTDTVNDYMTGQIPCNYKIYKSCDEVCAASIDSDDQFSAYPIEYLNTLNLQGLPRHELKLKVGMPVMLLRNINPSQGLCNGTRLIVTRTGEYIVEARIITGSNVGKHVLIPRIVLTSTDPKVPFILKRRQYPLKPCYAMTINKSQGQSLTHVGVYLPKPVFSHGQLYVAASRTTTPQGLRFFIDDSDQNFKGYTRNIVYKEVFSNLPVID
ncbi:uncharacterized protein LOC141637635 [Silene latifolia]|uniref:uncharacterized protein LOC141637635 n=1 Tax=Silene latifolia TaxID=37657 RepID=UPI003D781A7B